MFFIILICPYFIFICAGISEFDKVKKRIINRLSEDCFLGIHGSTDSEYLFALFLTFLVNKDEATDIEDTIKAVEKTIATVLELCLAAGVSEPCSLNLVISDGINVIATRYRNGSQMPPSLYYKYGCEFTCKNGRFDATSCKDACEVVISSAPLSGENTDFGSQCRGSDPGCPLLFDAESSEEYNEIIVGDDNKCHWILIPKDNMLVCLGDPIDSSKVTSVYLKPICLDAHMSIIVTPNLIKNFQACTVRARSMSGENDVPYIHVHKVK